MKGEYSSRLISGCRHTLPESTGSGVMLVIVEKGNIQRRDSTAVPPDPATEVAVEPA